MFEVKGLKVWLLGNRYPSNFEAAGGVLSKETKGYGGRQIKYSNTLA